MVSNVHPESKVRLYRLHTTDVIEQLDSFLQARGAQKLDGPALNPGRDRYSKWNIGDTAEIIVVWRRDGRLFCCVHTDSSEAAELIAQEIDGLARKGGDYCGGDPIFDVG